MCGIVGVFPLNVEGLEIDQKLRRLVSLYLQNEILLETVARGKDSTGMALSFGQKPDDPEGTPYWTVLKQPVPAEEFLANDGSSSRYKGQSEQANFERFMDVSCLINRPLKHILGHTRAKTQGSEFSMLNNHPILVGNIIGIHNGGVHNDRRIYELHPEMTKQGDVDSEAIIQLLAENAPERSLGVEDIKYVTERIEGPRAVLAYNRKYPDQVIFFRNSERPMELCYINELGLAVICSEQRFFRNAIKVYDRMRRTIRRDLPELTYEWRNILPKEGGVINVETLVNPELNIKDMFPLVDCSDVLENYKRDKPKTKVTPPHIPHKKKKTYTPPKTTPTGNTARRTGGLSTADKTKPITINKPELAEVELVETSSIKPEKYTTEVPDTLNADVIVDDDDAAENVAEVYSDEELIEKGIDTFLSEEVAQDENLVINRYKGNYRELFPKSDISEEEAAQFVHLSMPETFGQGFAYGFQHGAQEQFTATEMEAEQMMDSFQEMELEIQGLSKTNEDLEKKLSTEKKRLTKTARLIANMKAFIMASLITGELVHIQENEEGELLMELDNDLEDFINTTSGYDKLDMARLLNIFKDKDLKIIKNGFYKFSKMVEEENKAAMDDSMITDAVKLRGIKS